VFENISREHVNNSQNILSFNIINQKIDVQLQKKKKKVSFFPSMDRKINTCHKNVFQYKEDIKDIAKHVCYCVKTIY
jgi:peroxiredoxin